MKILLTLFTLYFSPILAGGVNSGSVFLMNDSPYILTATILAADGSYLGQVTVQPNQQTNFTQNFFTTPYEHRGFPNVSYTPFTVIWQCPSEEYYSVCTQVPTGSLVKANSCSSGNFYCKPKSKEQNKADAPASTIIKKK